MSDIPGLDRLVEPEAGLLGRDFVVVNVIPTATGLAAVLALLLARAPGTAPSSKITQARKRTALRELRRPTVQPRSSWEPSTRFQTVWRVVLSGPAWRAHGGEGISLRKAQSGVPRSAGISCSWSSRGGSAVTDIAESVSGKTSVE